MEKKGMVAVVQGLQDSSLTVTLLDGGKQYTLMPNNHVPQPRQVQHCHPSVHCGSQYTTEACSGSNVANRDSGIQATDGRYTSTYKMMHCNRTPTSPPQTVSEFPPQRSEVLHGHGNFVIGGSGSGETARPAVKTNSFRGAMVWPDKGSVCASRASIQSDAFANSLRKYTNITPERSSEIVQRLISFTQAKNMSKYQNRCPCVSPTRNSVDSECSKQTFVLERNSSRNSSRAKTIYQPEVSITKKNRGESSPERERSENILLEDNDDSWNRPMFCKNNDVRCFRDTARKLKQGFKNLVPTSSHNKSSRLENPDYDFYQRTMHERESKRSVNMEIQAGAKMESKEILTLPRIVPMQRTVAMPLSPISSKMEERIKEELKFSQSSFTELVHVYSCKSIQVKFKITSSSIDLRKSKNIKRSKSDQDLNLIMTNKPDSILSFLHEVDDNVNELSRKNPTSKKRICQNCKHLFDDFDILRRSISNNTYFREDFNFNINQSRRSKHFIEMSKHYYINGPDRINKDNNNNTQHQFQIQPEFCSHIDTGDGKTSTADTTKHIKRLRNPNNESCCDYDAPDSMSKFVNEERCNDFLFGTDKNCRQVKNKHSAMTHEEIKNLIDLNIHAFTEKYRINITTQSLADVIEELFHLFVTDVNNIVFTNKENLSDKIKSVLRNTGLSEYQTLYLTNILTEHFEEECLNNNSKINSSNFQSETLVVLPNIVQDSSEYMQERYNENDCCDFSIKEISQKDLDNNVEAYMSKISTEVQEWLFNLLVPEAKDEETRQAFVNDLSTDILDRHKYLELNPTCETSETSELEHLKYQIFKLIYKFGINELSLVDCAHELMKRIQMVAVPTFSIKEGEERKILSRKEEARQSIHNITEPSNLGASSSKHLDPNNVCCKRPTCKRNLNKTGISESISGKSISLREPKRTSQATTSTRRMSSPGKFASTNTNEIRDVAHSESIDINQPSKQYLSSKYIPPNRNLLFSGGIKIRDDESDRINNQDIIQMKPADVSEIDKAYQQYLKEWVEKIPLPIANAEDQMLAEEARADIYKDILNAVTKLRSEREIFNDRFLFEDKLDDEIEKLITKLPQSPELSSKKHILKVKLIEETSNINDLIKSPARSYKQQLLESLKGNLPKPTLSESENPDILEIYEELQILNIVEDFIIFSRFQNEDPTTAEAYRKKLVIRTENFVQELKENHGKALKNIDAKLYLTDILNILKNVPLPNNETIQEEADEILLSLEIDKWISELPLVQNNDYVEQLHRRRLRNNLAKQILGIRKDIRSPDIDLNNSLKHEISQFLGKAPLQQGQSLNINYMVDELVKKNDSKKVAFNEPDYEEFSKNMPLCSTYTEQPDIKLQPQYRRTPSSSMQEIHPTKPSHSERYYNIAKPLLDDLKIDQNFCKDSLSLEEIPNIETFNGSQPRSSTLNHDDQPNWFSLHENRNGQQQSKLSLDDIKNQNKIHQSNRSVQTLGPSEQSSHSRHYHNIARPLLDDLKQDSNCCNENLLNKDSSNGVSHRNSASEPNWYTLHETNQNHSKYPDDHFVPYPNNGSQQPEDQKHFFHDNVPEQVPQRYLQTTAPNHYELQTHDTSYDNLRSKKVNGIKSSIPHSDEDPRRRFSNTTRQRFSNSHYPECSSPKRHDSLRYNQRSPRLDQVASPHRASYIHRPPKEHEHDSSRMQNVIEDRSNGSPHVNRSDLFYKSTDPDGIRRTIHRNKSMEGDMGSGNPSKHFTEYYQPSVLIPPCYVPLRLRNKKGHVTDRNIDEGYREEDSDEENDEEDEVRCRCVEKMWKRKRVRYCPFEQYEGYPMCVPPPYFYPYFY